MPKYNPSKIESKWQRFWQQKKIFVVKDVAKMKGKLKENRMLLTEFPYPSGDLHIGHWYAFSLPDILARYWRMNGHNVMYPIGFDAFGLPAENAAIQRDIHPGLWTKKNIARMTKQLQSMGTVFDWSRKVETIDPNYYRWTQWMFLQFYKNGLAYRAATPVNWCPKDRTVLANEQVINGRCDRCGSEVVQKELSQWMFKITKFADALIDGLEKLDWQEIAKLGQVNWIGRSEGAVIKFSLSDVPGQSDGLHSVEVFTTRADTLYGATAIIVSPELAQKWIEVGWLASDKVKAYVKKSLSRRELERQETKEKTGVDAGIVAVNPASKEKIPVWVADYVLGRYGTGALMSVPAHDERDFEFAKKYGLSIKTVIEPETGEKLANEETRRSIVAIVEDPKSKKYLTLNWGPKLGGTLFIGGGREEGEDEVATARREIQEETGYTNLHFIQKTERMHHHYFAFSKNVARNIEVVGLHFILKNADQKEKNLQHDEKNNFNIEWLGQSEILRRMEDNNHLLCFRRLILGEIYSGHGYLVDSGEFNGIASGMAQKAIVASLARHGQAEFKKTYRLHDWILSRQRYWGVPIPMINCPQCGYQPVPEKELPIKLPPLKDFKPADDGRSPLAKARGWLRVKCPRCRGVAERETDTMDTFVDSSWYFIRYTDPKNKKTFASKKKMTTWLPVPMYLGGAEHTTMHLLYSRFFTKALYSLGHVEFDEPFTGRRNRGIILGPDGHKMSKSLGNVVNPDTEVTKYGADTVRMYLAFLGPYSEGGTCDLKGIVGVHRFLNRVWNLYHRLPKKSGAGAGSLVVPTVHRAIKRVGADIKDLKFNTVVSELMKLLNVLEKEEDLSPFVRESFLKMLAPLAPHLTEELWTGILGKKKSIHLESWPEYDKRLLEAEEISIAVQVNGKVRDVITIGSDTDEEKIRSKALTSESVKRHIEGREIVKIIFIPRKMLSIVVK